MVLEDVTEFESTPEGGKRVTKLDEILLNGNNINMVRKKANGLRKTTIFTN